MANPTDVAASAASALAESDLDRVREFTREPILLEGETIDDLTPGTARRRAVDDALTELEDGAEAPTFDWRQDYSLLLGLERVLSEDRPELLDGATLNEHQVDALSGTLAAITAELERAGKERQRRAAAKRARQRRPERERGRGRGRGRARGGRSERTRPSPTRPRRTKQPSRRSSARTRSPRTGRSRRTDEEDLVAEAPEDPGREPALLVRARDRRRQDGRRGRLRRGLAHRRHPDPHPPPQPRRSVHRRDLRPRLQGPALAAAARAARTAPTDRSRSRPTSGSFATPAGSRTPTRS